MLTQLRIIEVRRVDNEDETNELLRYGWILLDAWFQMNGVAMYVLARLDD